MDRTNSNDKYFDLKDLSEYSSLSVRTLRDYLADPDNPLPSYCIKRKILVRKSEFEKWMEQYQTNHKKLDTIIDEIVDECSSTH